MIAGRPADADLGCCQAHAFAKHVVLADAGHRRQQLVDEEPGLDSLAGQVEGRGNASEDRVAVLDDSGCFHPVGSEPQLGGVLVVVAARGNAIRAGSGR